METEENEESLSVYSMADILNDILNTKSKVGLVTLDLSGGSKGSNEQNVQRRSTSAILSSRHVDTSTNMKNFITAPEQIDSSENASAQHPFRRNILHSDHSSLFPQSSSSDSQLNRASNAAQINSGKSISIMEVEDFSALVQRDENILVKPSLPNNTSMFSTSYNSKSCVPSCFQLKTEYASDISRDRNIPDGYKTKEIDISNLLKNRCQISDKSTESDNSQKSSLDLFNTSSHTNKYDNNALTVRQAENVNPACRDNIEPSYKSVKNKFDHENLLCRKKNSLLDRKCAPNVYSLLSKISEDKKLTTEGTASISNMLGIAVQKDKPLLKRFPSKGSPQRHHAVVNKLRFLPPAAGVKRLGKTKVEEVQKHSRFVTPLRSSSTVQQHLPNRDAEIMSLLSFPLKMDDSYSKKETFLSQKGLCSSAIGTSMESCLTKHPSITTMVSTDKTLLSTSSRAQSTICQAPSERVSLCATSLTPMLPTLPAVPSKTHTASSTIVSEVSNIPDQSSNKASSIIDVTKLITVNGRQFIKLRKIGKGGSSIVYSVFDLEDLQNKALKIVSLENLEEAILKSHLEEIDLLQKLKKSSRVIKLYEFERTPHELKIVMEIGSLDLLAILRNARENVSQLNDFTVKHYWNEMLLSVQDIHKEGIIHSDLKPANFLLVGSTLKLIDFGIASSIQSDMTSVIKDNQGGTLNYMSPESLTDSRTTAKQDGVTVKIGIKSDIWSLGCILYVLAYGKTPFQHVTNIYQKMKVITDSKTIIAFPSTVKDENLVDVLKKCLQFNAKDRPSIKQLLEHPYLK